MTTISDPDTHESDAHGGHDDHHGHHGAPFMAHHFDSAEQQFDSGKLGMWIFLVTEVLFFSGLFVAYTVYRSLHPEIFQYASNYLNKYLGGINTAVLLFSSLTMAWGVRCAQLKQQKGLILCLTLTLFCAALFLGVKTFEYTEKYHKGLLWTAAVDQNAPMPMYGEEGSNADYAIRVSPETTNVSEEQFEANVMSSLGTAQFWFAVILLIPTTILAIAGFYLHKRVPQVIALCIGLSFLGIIIGIQSGVVIHHAMHGGEAHAGEVSHGDSHEESHAHKDGEHDEGDHGHDDHKAEATSHAQEDFGPKPRNLYVFFSIYYMMTGLHAFHIIAGMIAISWLTVRAVSNDFRPDYFGPVDYVGLYWHLVDLIWIFLFPMLYLIH